MASTEVDIYNSALVKVGAPIVVSPSENSRGAKLCSARYDSLRKKLLSLHPWNFSTYRVSLAATVNTPAFEYTHEFILPLDCLRVFDTDLVEDDPWEVEFNSDNNKVLRCNSSSIKIKYAKDVTDVSKFPPYFSEGLAWLLSSDIAYALTQSRSVAQDCYKAYKAEIAEARSMDAQEAGRQSFETNPWIDVRF